ncbi:helix-turn-helix domain-containing protein [Clostridium sp. WILCCON 0269]|uniref:Helix-turn-helix domain-containing protein n=1 Tax=Candidatus Clostridium eludens TaxID=3381663 RepID=A0ABW8SHN5_9CLOT
MLDKELLMNLIQSGYESDFLDFKAKQYNKDKYSDLIKDIMSMANAHYEGDKYIVIGIKYNPSGDKDVIGISDEQFVDVSVYQQIIMDNIEPEIKFDYIPFGYESKLIGIFKIYGQNNERPYMVKKQKQGLHIGQCYIRKGANNVNAVRNDFDIFYSLKERFELRFMQEVLSAEYPNEGCARISITMRNYTKLPIVIISGELIVFNCNGQQLTRHLVYGFDDKIIGADFKLNFTPMEEKFGELFVGFSSTDCSKLGLSEYGITDERFIFQLKLYDTNENEYRTIIEDGFVFAKGDFLWKVQLKAKKENDNNRKFSLKKMFSK